MHNIPSPIRVLLHAYTGRIFVWTGGILRIPLEKATAGEQGHSQVWKYTTSSAAWGDGCQGGTGNRQAVVSRYQAI